MTSLQTEIARNFDYFQRTLATHLRSHAGQFALLRDATIVDYFDWPGDADRAGMTAFADGLYSIQQVTGEPVELGLYANAKA